MLRKFLHSDSGNLGLMAAFLMVPLAGSVGIALDYSNALALKTRLQSAADAAAVSAVSYSSPGVAQVLKMSGDGEVAIGHEDATRIFFATIGDKKYFTLDSLEANIVKKDNQISSVITFRANIPTTLSRVLGKEMIAVGGKATAEYQTQIFRDFYLLLDNTPSMGVGATPSDVSTMVSNTPDQCAFACHIVNNGVEDSNSYYNLAKSLGVTTRINVVAQATSALMSTAEETRRTQEQFRMAVYTFGQKAEDTKLLEVATLTSDLDDAKQKAAAIDLMSIPYQGYDNDQQTDFDRALAQIGDKMGTPGDGLSSASPEKILFFVSDGVGDSYKPSFCTQPTTSGRCQEPIDTTYCQSLKENGYKIAVLYTTYLPLPTNGWYNYWIAPFQDQIGSRMEECASPGLFFEVSPTEGISDAMTTLFKKIINSPRLTG